MLHKITLTLAAAAIVAMSAAATAHPLSHIPNAVGTGHPSPPRVGWGPQAGSGYGHAPCVRHSPHGQTSPCPQGWGQR